MGIFSRFEDKMEDTVEGAASRMSKAPISPVQIAKKAERQMRRETMVGAGKQYAPTLYTVLVNPDDDERLFGYYPTLAGETETYLKAKASEEGLVMDGNPLVRFIVDDGLRHGKFDVIAEMVAAPIVAQLRDEEMERYGIIQQRSSRGRNQEQRSSNQRQHRDPYERDPYSDTYQDPYDDPYDDQEKPPLPYVPENELDRSIDYGEYTFNSEDFEEYRSKSDSIVSAPLAYNDEPRQNRQSVQPSNTVAFTPGSPHGAKRSSVEFDHRNVRARLVDITNNRPYDLAGAVITLGRESGNDIKIQDINASRKHAELRMNQQGLWVINDLNSMNGTRVNGVSIASQPLYPGDIVTIGKTEFEFALA